MVRNKSSTGTVSSWVTFPCLTRLQTWSMTSNLNNKKHHLSCRPPGDWPGYRHPRMKKKQKRSNRTYEVIDWYTDTRHRKKSHPCGTVIRKSTDIQPDRRCKIFPNYKKMIFTILSNIFNFRICVGGNLFFGNAFVFAFVARVACCDRREPLS